MALTWPLQESITKQVNDDPNAGWEATMNPRFANYTVSIQLAVTLYDYFLPLLHAWQDASYYAQVGQFKHILGVKPTPQKDLESIPLITHPKLSKLPTSFDARTAWPQCSTIGRILGKLLDWFIFCH